MLRDGACYHEAEALLSMICESAVSDQKISKEMQTHLVSGLLLLLHSALARKDFLNAIESRGLELYALNCSANAIDPDERTASHADWANKLKTRYTFTEQNAMDILQKEVGIVFSQVLEHAGVFKRTETGKQAFLRFAQSVN